MDPKQLVVRLCLIGGGMGLGGWIAQKIVNLLKVQNIKLLPVVLACFIFIGGLGGFGGYCLGKKLDKPREITSGTPLTPIVEC